MCEKIEKRKKERKRTRIDSVCCHVCHGWRVVRIKYPLSSRFFPRPRRWSIETRRWARRRAARQTTVIALANQCKWNLSFSIVLHFIYLYLPLLSLFTFSSFFTPSFYLFLFTLPACMPFFAFFFLFVLNSRRPPRAQTKHFIRGTVYIHGETTED